MCAQEHVFILYYLLSVITRLYRSHCVSGSHWKCCHLALNCNLPNASMEMTLLPKWKIPLVIMTRRYYLNLKIMTKELFSTVEWGSRRWARIWEESRFEQLIKSFFELFTLRAYLTENILSAHTEPDFPT